MAYSFFLGLEAPATFMISEVASSTSSSQPFKEVVHGGLVLSQEAPLAAGGSCFSDFDRRPMAWSMRPGQVAVLGLGGLLALTALRGLAAACWACCCWSIFWYWNQRGSRTYWRSGDP
jgi:hypothetical protein